MVLALLTASSVVLRSRSRSTRAPDEEGTASFASRKVQSSPLRLVGMAEHGMPVIVNVWLSFRIGTGVRSPRGAWKEEEGLWMLLGCGQSYLPWVVTGEALVASRKVCGLALLTRTPQ